MHLLLPSIKVSKPYLDLEVFFAFIVVLVMIYAFEIKIDVIKQILLILGMLIMVEFELEAYQGLGFAMIMLAYVKWWI